MTDSLNSTKNFPASFGQLAKIAFDVATCNGLQDLAVFVDRGGVAYVRWRNPGDDHFTYADSDMISSMIGLSPKREEVA